MPDSTVIASVAAIITDAPVPCAHLIQKDTHTLYKKQAKKKKCRAPVDVSTVAAVRGVPVVVVEISPSPLVSASQPFLNFFPHFFMGACCPTPTPFAWLGPRFFMLASATRLLGRVVFLPFDHLATNS